jgi:5-methylcytosine-specific restriction endonuclease McrA
MNDPHSTTGTPGECWLCHLHTARIDEHIIDHDHYELRDCKAAETGVSVPLCPRCHTAAHQWMRSHGRPGTNAAADALDALLDRFMETLLPGYQPHRIR